MNHLESLHSRRIRKLLLGKARSIWRGQSRRDFRSQADPIVVDGLHIQSQCLLGRFDTSSWVDQNESDQPQWLVGVNEQKDLLMVNSEECVLLVCLELTERKETQGTLSALSEKSQI